MDHCRDLYACPYASSILGSIRGISNTAIDIETILPASHAGECYKRGVQWHQQLRTTCVPYNQPEVWSMVFTWVTLTVWHQWEIIPSQLQSVTSASWQANVSCMGSNSAAAICAGCLLSLFHLNPVWTETQWLPWKLQQRKLVRLSLSWANKWHRLQTLCCWQQRIRALGPNC